MVAPSVAIFFRCLLSFLLTTLAWYCRCWRALLIDLSGFDTLSYVINWAETITVIWKRLMKHCLIPADLTSFFSFFFQNTALCSFPLVLLFFQRSRMEPSSSLCSFIFLLIPCCAAAAIRLDLTCDSRLDKELECFESTFHDIILK